METTGALARKMEVEARFKSGARWFFWIAGLSMLNAVLIASGSSITFVVGLGATIVVDAVALHLRQGGGNATLIIAVSLAIDAFIAGFFVLFGVLALKRNTGAFVAGMILYAADAALLAWAQDWFSCVFHALALWFLFSGLQACRQMPAAEAALSRAVAADIANTPAAPTANTPALPAEPGTE